MYVYVCIYVCIFIYIHSAETQYCEILNISKETSPMECWCWRPDKYQQQIWYLHYISRITEPRPGPRLNMKTVYSRHDCSHVNRLLFILPPPPPPGQYPIRRLITRSREISKPRDLCLEFSDRSQIFSGISTALLLRRMPIFETIRYFKLPISRGIKWSSD